LFFVAWKQLTFGQATPPPRTWTNCQHSGTGAMAAMAEEIGDFWRKKDYISVIFFSSMSIYAHIWF